MLFICLFLSSGPESSPLELPVIHIHLHVQLVASAALGTLRVSCCSEYSHVIDVEKKQKPKGKVTFDEASTRDPLFHWCITETVPGIRKSRCHSGHGPPGDPCWPNHCKDLSICSLSTHEFPGWELESTDSSRSVSSRKASGHCRTQLAHLVAKRGVHQCVFTWI